MENKNFPPSANDLLGKHLEANKEKIFQTGQPEPEKVEQKPSTEADNKVVAKAEVQTPTKQEESPAEEFNLSTNWDDEAPLETPKEQPKTESKFDFSTFVKDTGIEAKSEDEFKAKLKEYQSKLSKYESAPEQLRKALELSTKGADYLSYLKVSQVDYSKIKPEDFYKDYITRNLSPEEAQTHLDTVSPVDMKLQGIRLRDEAIAYQNHQMQEFERSAEMAAREAEIRREKANLRLQETLNKVDDIAGLKLSTSHKSDIYDAITTGRMQQELFFDQKTGEYDYNGMIQTYFVKKNLPKILAKLEKATTSKTRKEIINDLQNVQVERPSEKPAAEQVQKSQMEIYMENVFKGMKTTKV